jgi:hypothetical protein
MTDPRSIGHEVAVGECWLAEAGNEACYPRGFAACGMQGPEMTSTRPRDRPAVSRHSVQNFNSVQIWPSATHINLAQSPFSLSGEVWLLANDYAEWKYVIENREWNIEEPPPARWGDR